MTLSKDISNAIQKKKLIIGMRRVVKEAKNGRVTCIIYTITTPPALLKELEHYSSVSDIALKQFKEDSIRLGQVCGKPFAILVAGIAK